jgi:MFS family permease
MDSNDRRDEEIVPMAQEKYSVFTKNEKRCITAIAAYAASFSTLSSFIYFPALPRLAADLSVSVDAINLTVTTYMAMATIAPTLMGDAADVLGRRPACLVAFCLYVVTNIATALTKSYVALLVLRLFQALFISGSYIMPP